MNFWFCEILNIRQLFMERGFDMVDEPEVEHARHKIWEALKQLQELRLTSEEIVERVSRSLKQFNALRTDNLVWAEALAHEEPSALFRDCEVLTQRVTEMLFPCTPDSSYQIFVDEILVSIAGEPITDWLLATRRLSERARELDLELSRADIIVALVVITAVILAVYYRFFWRGRDRANKASEDFSLVAKRHQKEPWAKELLSQGKRQTWTLNDAWQGAVLDSQQRRAAILALSQLEKANPITPSKGERFDPRIMSSPQKSGDFIWDLEMPGFKWNGILLEKAQVVRAEAEYLALVNSEEQGREIYIQRFKQRKLRDPRPTDQLDAGLVEDVYDVLGNDLPAYDQWLQSLIESCPDASLAPACPESEIDYNEHRMATDSPPKIKSDSKVTKRLHRGLVRKGFPDDIILFRALVEATDGMPADPTELL